MTFQKAFRAAIAPYLLPDQTIELLLLQQGLEVSDEYEPKYNTPFYKAVIAGLYQLKTLKKEKDPASENEYDNTQIDDLINHYKHKIGDEEDDSYMFIDRTDEW